MRSFWIFFLLNFSYLLSLSAQEGLPVYSDYLTDNWYLVHPAMAGTLYHGGQIRMTGRQQWFDQELAPALQTLAASYRISDKSGGGFLAFNDRNGFYATTGAYVTYTHHLYVGPNAKEVCNCLYPDPKNSLNELAFGISIGTVFNTIDQRNFDVSQFDPLIVGVKQQKGYLSMDAGLAYINPRYYVQLSVKNLLFSPHNRFGDFYYPYNRNRANYRRVLAGVGKFFELGKIILEPSVLFQWAEISNEKSLDSNLKAYFPMQSNQIWFGLSHRMSFRPEGFYLQTRFEKQRLQSITPLMGINVGTWMFSYNYAFVTGALQFDTSGFHQLSIGYNIDRY
ncbi:MAG: hypothetical protein RLZZ241_110 [Bacteroidota bacterium]|jgi:type IX secretion system PorP/SprF family membrane protein